MQEPRRSRRSLLAVGATGLATTAGCISAPFGNSGPEERTYSIALTDGPDGITASIEPSGDVEDVIRVRVGDDVTFDVENRRDVPTVFHNHVPHEEMTVDAGGAAEMTFTPTEETVGAHEVEVFDAEATGGGNEHDGGDDEHDGGGHDADEVYVILTVEVRPAGS